MEIKNLYVQKNEHTILNNLSVHFEKGNTHIIMGPNGSGKSTLSNVIVGHPDCIVKEGNILYQNEDILSLKIHERAIKGIHLSPQYPPVIEGLSHAAFLKESLNVRNEQKQLDPVDDFEFLKLLREKAKKYNFNPKTYPRQSLNQGFSGGEKKRNEILQIDLLNPDFIILDEIDSGLDIETMKHIAQFLINYMKDNQEGNKTLVVITHYPEFAKLLNPNQVHILKSGQIIKSAKNEESIELINQILQNGFGGF